MLRALGKKKSSGTDAGGVATSKSDAGNSASSNRNRRRSRSPFRVRGRSRSKSRDRKSSKRKNASSKAAAIMEANAKIGIASPEPTLGGAVHGSAASTPSTACSSVGSSSMSPYAQDNDDDDDDAFFRMQTEKYNKMMVGGASVAAAAKSTIPAPSIRVSDISNSSSSSSSSSSRGAPQDSNRTIPMPTYLSNSRSSSRLKTSSFGTIVEEEEEDIDEEDGVVNERSVSFKNDDSNDENADSAPAPSPERFLHRATADEKMRPPSARVTFAGDGPTSSFQPPSRNRIFLLLLEPNKKVFELIQVEYDAKTATVGYILGLIKLHASEQALVRQKHVGLIRPRDDVELTDRTMLATSQGRIKHGEVLIPLPEDCRSSKCRRLAKTILKTPSVVKLLSKEQPLASRPRRRSKSRSRRSVSPGRRGTSSSRTNAHADEAMRRAALEEASRTATKALEDKIAQLEKRLADVASSSSSQKGGSNKELSDKIRKEIEEKAEAREELEEQMKKEAEMSAAERIEQMAKEAEKSAASEKPSHRSHGVQPMSFSFENEKVEESSGIAAAMESVSDILADGIKIVKPKLRRVRNTIRSVKKRARRSKNKPLIAASVGVLLFSFLYGFFGGSTTEESSDNFYLTEESSSMIISSSLPYAIVGLVLGGSALIFFANSLTKATGRSRRSSALRSSSRKKGRLLRGASNIRSANAASRRRGQMGR